jgi:hypothetical protein
MQSALLQELGRLGRTPSGALKWIVPAVLSAFMLLLLWVLPSVPFLPAAQFDQATLEAASSVDAAVGGADSFASTAVVYNAIAKVVDLKLLLSVVGPAALFFAFTSANTLLRVAVASAWCFVATALDLSYASKDLFVVIICWMTATQLRATNHKAVGILISITMLISYAMFVRQYYYVIAGFAAAILLARRLPGRTLIILMSATPLLVYLGIDWVAKLEAARDTVNIYRISADADGFRTAFLNPFNLHSPGGVMANYAYAAGQLMAPFAFGHTLKDLLFTPFIAAVTLTLCWALASADLGRQWAGALIAGYLLTAFTFEPDVGSFARHASSFFPLLGVIFAKRVNAPGIVLASALRPTQRALAT